MATYYLKADSEDAMWEALHSAGLAEKRLDEDDENNIPPESLGMDEVWEPSGAFSWAAIGCEVDVIGEISNATGDIVEGEDGSLNETVEALTGFHANIAAVQDRNKLVGLPLIPRPRNPKRKWAGDD